jgi:TetR/AcrR family transcriptional repressor of lmrAB and yxaGH operons
VPTQTRAKMISAAVGLLQRRGLTAMSFSDVLAESGAARGAIYHHFPGGKHELAAVAATSFGEDVRGYLAQLPFDNPREVVDAFLASVRPVLQASAAGGGCAVAAVAQDTTSDEHRNDLRLVAHTAFSSWASELTDKFHRAGMDPGDASDLAHLMIATLEGAHVLCRAAASIAPFDSAARALRAIA